MISHSGNSGDRIMRDFGTPRKQAFMEELVYCERWSPSRIFIVGGPRSGKSTLAKLLAEHLHIDHVRATDDWKAHRRLWKSTLLKILAEMEDSNPKLIFEGVTVAHALQLWRAKHPNDPPCDTLVVLRKKFVQLTPEQKNMSKGIDTIVNSLLPWLRRLGVDIRIIRDYTITHSEENMSTQENEVPAEQTEVPQVDETRMPPFSEAEDEADEDEDEDFEWVEDEEDEDEEYEEDEDITL